MLNSLLVFLVVSKSQTLLVDGDCRLGFSFHVYGFVNLCLFFFFLGIDLLLISVCLKSTPGFVAVNFNQNLVFLV
jgi:hypothetical protein